MDGFLLKVKLRLVCQKGRRVGSNVVFLNRCYYVHKICSIRDQFEASVLIELIRVLVLSRVDYFHSLYYGLSNFMLSKLQQMMTASACLIFRLSLSTLTSLFLKLLHWFGNKQRIVFNASCCSCVTLFISPSNSPYLKGSKGRFKCCFFEWMLLCSQNMFNSRSV